MQTNLCKFNGMQTNLRQNRSCLWIKWISKGKSEGLWWNLLGQESWGHEGHYLDFNDGFSGVHICKNIDVHICFYIYVHLCKNVCYICTVYFMYINFNSKNLLKIAEKKVKCILTAYPANIFVC